MTTAAWITMISTMTIVIAFTGYFFVKVLRTPTKEDDSYIDQE